MNQLKIGLMFTRVRSVLVLLLGFQALAQAAEYHVGLTSSPNLAQVLKTVGPGDIILLEGDATYPGTVTIDRDGASGNPIVLRGVSKNGKRPCIAGTNQGPQGSVIRVLGSHVTVDNLEITAAGAKLQRGFYSVGDDVTLQNSVVHDVPGQGIHISDAAGSFTMTGVEVHHCGGGDRAHQVYASSSLTKYPQAVFRMEGCYVHDALGGISVKSRATTTQLYSNWIEGALYHELDLIGPDPKAQGAAVREGRPHNAEVVENVIIKRPGSMGLMARLGTDGLASSNGTYRFAFNTFVVQAPKSATNTTIFKLQGQIAALDCESNLCWRADGGKLIVTDYNPRFPTPSVQITGASNYITPNSTGVPETWKDTRFLDRNPFIDPGQDRYWLARPLDTGRTDKPKHPAPNTPSGPGSQRSDSNPGAFPVQQ